MVTVTVSNTGGPARDAGLALQFDPQLVGVGAVGLGQAKAGRWPLGTLPAGGKLQIQFPAKCAAEAPRACAKMTATAEGAAEVAGEAYVRIVAAPYAGEPAHPDHEAIQGVWQVVAAMDSGRESPNEMIENMQLLVAGARFAFWDRTHPTPELLGTFTLDPAEAPKRVDWTLGEGKLMGIYELDGDRLRICFDERGDARPTKFVSEPDSPNDVLLTLRRVGDAEAAVKRLKEAQGVAGLAQAKQDEVAVVNLKRIGLAMHNFHDA